MPLPTLAHLTAAANGPRAHRAWVSAVLCVTLATMGCAKKDYKSETGRTRAWTATLELARQQHGLRATNDAITRQLLDRAIEARAKEEPLLAHYAKSDSERVAARGVLDSLQQQIRQLEQATR